MNREDLLREVTFKTTHSGGPGGQHVNKVATAAILYWEFEQSSLLSRDQKDLVIEKLDKSINKENYLYVRSDRFRDLDRNKEDCIDKLIALLQKAFYKPKKRKPTKPTRASKERRLKEKNERGRTKKMRQKPDW